MRQLMARQGNLSFGVGVQLLDFYSSHINCHFSNAVLMNICEGITERYISTYRQKQTRQKQAA